MSDQEEEGLDGPDAEANDQERQAGEADCVEPEADDGRAEFTSDDEYQEAFGSPRVLRVLDSDGMPTPVVDDVGDDAHAPAFLPEENQVCAGIYSSFVTRDAWGDVIAAFAPEEVGRAPNGDFYVSADLWRERTSRNTVIEGDRVRVEPVRPPCKHYLLQLRPPPPSLRGVLKYGMLFRYCSVRRTVAGAFMSLTEEAMRSCSMREPFDVKSSEIIRAFDRDLEEKAKHRTHEPMFRDRPWDRPWVEEKKPAEKKEEPKDTRAFDQASEVILGQEKPKGEGTP